MSVLSSDGADYFFAFCLRKKTGDEAGQNLVILPADMGHTVMGSGISSEICVKNI